VAPAEGGGVNQILSSAALAATPLILAAMGGLINRRGGIVNIALEGKMLLGAVFAVLVSASTGSWVLGMVAAGVAGLVGGAVFTFCVTRLGANEILAGLGFNTLAAGLIGYALKDRGTYDPSGISVPPQLHLPLIADIPLLGPIVSDKDPVTYLTWLLVPLLAWALVRTRAGLRLRAAGASQDVAHALGLRGLAIRDASTLVAGLLAGLGGGQLALALVGLFNTGMVAGRGFIAMAAFYFGRARPLPTAIGCALFALFDAIQIRLQQDGVPTQLVSTIPYLVVVGVLAFAALSARRPAKEATA
jgi:simple sugar transport system permease protein